MYSTASDNGIAYAVLINGRSLPTSDEKTCSSSRWRTTTEITEKPAVHETVVHGISKRSDHSMRCSICLPRDAGRGHAMQGTAWPSEFISPYIQVVTRNRSLEKTACDDYQTDFRGRFISCHRRCFASHLNRPWVALKEGYKNQYQRLGWMYVV